MTTQQPEALELANWLDAVGNGDISSTAAAAELRRQHARIAELEAQLEAIGAGGVSGPLMGRASIAASAGSEPVAWLVCSVNSDGTLSLEHAAAWQEAAHEHINDAITEHGIDEAASWVVRPAYTHPSPPEGMAGWKWVPVEPTEDMLAAAHDSDREYTLRNFGDVMTVMQGPYDHWAAMIDAAPPPPTTSASSGKGE